MNESNSIEITIDSSDSNFSISGDVGIIQSNRRLRSNFESYGAIFDNNLILIPFSTTSDPTEDSNQDNQYRAILRLCDKFKIKYSKTNKTKSLVDQIDKEHESFNEFSLKAKNIRNNKHEKDDFVNFQEVISNSMIRQPYPLQLLSAYHLAFAQHACNFSVPGTGKTAIVYTAYSYLKNLPENNPKSINRIFIICPLSAFGPWQDEFKECFGKEPSVKQLVGMGLQDRNDYYYSDQYSEITLISYQSASNDVDGLKDFLKRQKNRVMLVLDEAHRIKNVNGGKWAEAVLSIAKYANSRVILTGTPAPNGYYDLWNLFKFIWPDRDIIGFPQYYLEHLSEDNGPKSLTDKKRLVDNISPFFLRIKKSDFKDFPKAIYNDPIFVKMSPTQRNIYDYIEENYISYLESDDNSSNFLNKLKSARLIRLMQCVTNPKLLDKPLDSYMLEDLNSGASSVDDREIMRLIKEYDPKIEIPPKFIQILELLKVITKKKGPAGKVIIWTIFIQNIYDLQQFLNNNGFKCELLYGLTPTESTDSDEESVLTRGEIIKEFHSDSVPYKVIIANPFAVGESISLHKACHNAIYMEKNYNASMYMQSKDRIHRYGLAKNDEINYYYLISEDSIDESIHEKVLAKEARMLDIIESEEIPLLNMNMDEDEGVDEDDIQMFMRDYYARKASRA
jgi:SNF2 family DNA or RNA helicase